MTGCISEHACGKRPPLWNFRWCYGTFTDLQKLSNELNLCQVSEDRDMRVNFVSYCPQDHLRGVNMGQCRGPGVIHEG